MWLTERFQLILLCVGLPSQLSKHHPHLLFPITSYVWLLTIVVLKALLFLALKVKPLYVCKAMQGETMLLAKKRRGGVLIYMISMTHGCQGHTPHQVWKRGQIHRTYLGGARSGSFAKWGQSVRQYDIVLAHSKHNLLIWMKTPCVACTLKS